MSAMIPILTTASEFLGLAADAYLRDGSLGLTELQREKRRTAIGASDAGAIVAGGKEWPSLWAQKTGRTDGDDLSDVLAVMMGHWTEPFNRCWYTMHTGREVKRVGELVRHPTIPYLAVNLDGVSTTVGGHPCAWQAKHVGKTGDQVTLRYTAQCTHEALCLGLDWWAMSSFVGNSRWELVEQEVNPFFAADYLERCAEFWAYVKNDREPPDDVPTLGVPAPATALITVDLANPEHITRYNWAGAMIDEMAAFARTLPAHQAHEISKKVIKELLPENVGTVLRGKIKVAKDRGGAVRITMSKGGVYE